MSTLSFSVMPSAPEVRKGRIAGFLMNTAQAVKAEWRARCAARHAEALSDATLHDIGITRGEIDRAVRFGRAGF